MPRAFLTKCVCTSGAGVVTIYYISIGTKTMRALKIKHKDITEYGTGATNITGKEGRHVDYTFEYASFKQGAKQIKSIFRHRTHHPL